MNDELEQSEAVSAPSKKTVYFLIFLCIAAALGVGAWLSYRMNTSPASECSYRGGTWSTDTQSCVFENGAGEHQQEQVGAKVTSVKMKLPDADAEVTFADVEVGDTAKDHTTEFTIPDAPVKGSVTLAQELARIHKGTGDLVMPFSASYGGSGTFSYLGVFSKEGDAYALKSFALVGDRVGLSSLSLLDSTDNVGYVARLGYRDRLAGQPMAAVPTDTRQLEATVVDHAVKSLFVTSREGLLYKDLVKVSEPALHADVSSPLTVKGEARGPWYFEASFPVELKDASGKIVAQGPAHANGEWMTQDFVPFSVSLIFDGTYESGPATLILHKDNPSGLPENEDSFSIPVVLTN